MTLRRANLQFPIRYGLICALAISPAVVGAQRISSRSIVAAGNGTPSRSELAFDRRSAVPGKPAPSKRSFVAGDWYLSPRVYMGGVEENAKAFGLSVERAIRSPEDEGDGVWALGVSFDRYAYTYAGLVDVAVTPIGAILSYHLALENPRIDPYVGAGLGYFIVSASADGVSGVSASSTFFQSQLGVRYFVTDALAVGAHVGSGIGNIAIGATLRF